MTQETLNGCMKARILSLFGYAIGLALCTVSAAPSDQARDKSELERTLGGVPVLELPSKAAGLVSSARPRDREQVTQDVLEAAIAARPTAAPSVVGAIIRANPSVATVAATTAARLQPEQRSAITRAATTAAPDQSQNIVTALNKEKGENNGQGEEHRSDQGNAHARGPRPPGPPAFERPVGRPPGRPPVDPPTTPPGQPPGRPPGHYERP